MAFPDRFGLRELNEQEMPLPRLETCAKETRMLIAQAMVGDRQIIY